MKRIIIMVTMLIGIVLCSKPLRAAEKAQKDEDLELPKIVSASVPTTSERDVIKKEIANQRKKIAKLKKRREKTEKKIKELKAKQSFIEKTLMPSNIFQIPGNELWKPFSFHYNGTEIKQYEKDKEKLEVDKKECTQHIKKEKQILSKQREKMKDMPLNREITFNPNDVTELSNISVSQMKHILKETELEKYAKVYVEIEKEYKINAVAFCALSALESGWGTSKRAKEDHNYTGFGVYSEEAEGINAKNGEENLRMTAKHLQENYLTEGAIYNNGKSLSGINERYCVGDTWAGKITNIGYRLMEKLSNYLEKQR